MSHTKEPWIADGYIVRPAGSNELFVAIAYDALPDGQHSHEIDEANARRIALCVNYCAGKSNEELEQHILNQQ